MSSTLAHMVKDAASVVGEVEADRELMSDLHCEHHVVIVPQVFL